MKAVDRGHSKLAALAANARAELESGAIFFVITAVTGSVAIFPEDIVGKSDDELLVFICARLAEQSQG